MFKIVSSSRNSHKYFLYIRNLKNAHLTYFFFDNALSIFKISDVQIQIIICFVSKKNDKYVFKG